MSQNKEELLIDHLDLTIQSAKPAEPVAVMGDDEMLKHFWNNLVMSVDLIREAGLKEQVTEVRRQFESARSFSSAPAKVRHLNYRVAMRVAASVLLLAGAGLLYKYITTSPEELYHSQFTAYTLSSSRGGTVSDGIEQAYRNSDWRQVIRLGEQMQKKSGKSIFLSGIAAMEMKEYDVAILDFKQILQKNLGSGDDYFQDEAEYYLALSYLAAGNSASAIPILDKIRSDKQHRFHKKACEISAIDLRILSAKESK
jgi:tetratricopeptide (TPR) repeat protein